MSIDKKKIGKILKVTAIGTGVTFLGLNMIAKKKKGDSVFEKEKDQKNPFAGKKVVFVEDESDEENTALKSKIHKKKILYITARCTVMHLV